MIWLWLLIGLSLVGVILNIKKVRVCFIIWTGTNLAWAIVDFKIGLIAQGVLFVIYAGLAIWGFIAWRKKMEKYIFPHMRLTIHGPDLEKA